MAAAARGAHALTRQEWWESFYSQHRDLRDWYIDADVALQLVAGDVRAAAGERPLASQRVLHVGCGSSELPALLVQLGVGGVTSIDYSEQVVADMQKRWATQERLSFECMDACALAFRDAEFDVVLDKGTLDCVALKGDDDARRMMRELSRVLRAGGRCLVFSLRAAPERLALFGDEGCWASVETRCVATVPPEQPDQQEIFLYSLVRAQRREGNAKADTADPGPEG